MGACTSRKKSHPTPPTPPPAFAPDEIPGAIIPSLKTFPALERTRGFHQAAAVSARVAAAVPDNASEEVQIACAIAAIEEEHYADWPSSWFIAPYLTELVNALSRLTPYQDLTRFQRARYDELRAHPDLLASVTHGFTRKLRLDDKHAFVQELIRAGRRLSPVADELSAVHDVDVLHIALSYRHADKPNRSGTIDRRTAEEAHQVATTLPLVKSDTTIRVWIDQNLHRYPTSAPWYQRGFLPYTLMTVVSALHQHGGLAVAARRPWLWVETGMALSAQGVHCLPQVVDTLEDIVVIPTDFGHGVIPSSFELFGRLQSLADNRSVFDSVSDILRSVSLWTPDLLNHHDYEYVHEFSQFRQWAKAQTVRLKSKQALDLTDDVFQQTLLEDVAWLRSMPSIQVNRQEFSTPYLRIEMPTDKAKRITSLFKASAKCLHKNGVTEMLSTNKGAETFCFSEGPEVTFFNVNPSKDRSPALRIYDSEWNPELDNDFEKLKHWRGGCSIWDPRFAGAGPPRYATCGSIFGRHYGKRPQFAREGQEIVIGGYRFRSDTVTSYGMRVERVYECHEGGMEIYISESDVLCLRDLSDELQREFISALCLENAAGSISRILKAQKDITNIDITPRVLGSSWKEIREAKELSDMRARIGPEEVLIRRSRIEDTLYLISLKDEKWGWAFYTFNTTAPTDVDMGTDLVGFKTGGDVDSALAKVRLMMGSDEFGEYSERGLSLGIGRRSGKDGNCPVEYRLDGSEFLLCGDCTRIFSPVNRRVAVVSSWWKTRKVRVEWCEAHRCGDSGATCSIVGVAD